MGASYSSEEEGGDDVAGGVTKNIVSEEIEDNVIHKPREEGDGMERPPEAAVTSDNNPEDCDNTENKCDNEAGGEQKQDSDKSNEEDNKIVTSVASPRKFIEVNLNIRTWAE